MQIILEALLLDRGARSGIELGSLSAKTQIDLIHVLHQFDRGFLSYIFVQRSAEIVGDIIFSVGESARSSEAAHNGTALAVDAGLDLISVDRTFALFQLMSHLKHRYFESRFSLRQFVGCKDTAGPCSDYDHIIHIKTPLSLCFALYYTDNCMVKSVFSDNLNFFLLIIRTLL